MLNPPQPFIGHDEGGAWWDPDLHGTWVPINQASQYNVRPSDVYNKKSGNGKGRSTVPCVPYPKKIAFVGEKPTSSSSSSAGYMVTQ